MLTFISTAWCGGLKVPLNAIGPVCSNGYNTNSVCTFSCLPQPDNFNASKSGLYEAKCQQNDTWDRASDDCERKLKKEEKKKKKKYYALE